MTLTPFLATDSLVFLYVVTLHPVSGITLKDSKSEREGGGGRGEGKVGDEGLESGTLTAVLIQLKL